MENKKNIKAEITTQQLILIIILIVSFVIILFFIFRLNLGETNDKNICHNSVVLKSTSKGFIGSLDCRTNYVCISGGGECEGIIPSETIDVDADYKGEIMEAIADEMADCWWMFGEGDLNYLGISDKKFSGKTTCALCSIIKFDEKILEKNYEISYREFYNYLNSIKIDEYQTYFTYLYDSYDVDEFQEDISYLQIDIDDTYILGDEKYAIVTGMKSSAIWGVAKKDIFIFPYYVKSKDVNSELKCQDILTKA